MNTRLSSASFRSTAVASGAGRAALSPIRTIRPGASTRSTRVGVSASDKTLRFEPVPVTVPAWHRGPLDRLQPLLTRFRD